jgi:hypothetical protein
MLNEFILPPIFSQLLPPVMQDMFDYLFMEENAGGFTLPPSSIAGSAAAAVSAAAAAATAGVSNSGANRSCVGGSNTFTSIPWDPLAFPPHVLALMSQFLKLQGYSDAFLQSSAKANNLLRLAMGVTDDGDGSEYSVKLLTIKLHSYNTTLFIIV